MSTLWPYVEARKIINRMGDSDKEVIFETGYGPSGLPHIGTFGEVARTTWVQKAYNELTGKSSQLIAFSDDMDALRKTPDNIPNKELLDNNLGYSLSKVPNPFNTDHKSFADHNNHMLMSFLDSFNFKYTFASSTEYYTSGRFNDALQKMAEKHEEICKVVRPTLRGERAEEWSPFMPIHPLTGKVMTVPILSVNSTNGTITWKDVNGDELSTSIYDGNCKIQWKADWALRWYALGVDYEMSGKDLIDSVKLSSKICRILGGNPPINLTYELFLDIGGGKISKSKGNGFTIDEWLEIASPESLELFMFNNPQRAKKISKEIALQMEEDYIKLNNSHQKNISENITDESNPIGNFIVAQYETIPVSYSTIINIVSASGCNTEEDVWVYLKKYDSNIDTSNVYISQMVSHAIKYFQLYVEPNRSYRSPTDVEKIAIIDLRDIFSGLEESDHTEEKLQYWTFEVGKKYEFNLRDWFKALYEILLGQTAGPRFGVFVKMYGVQDTINLINQKIGNYER